LFLSASLSLSVDTSWVTDGIMIEFPDLFRIFSGFLEIIRCSRAEPIQWELYSAQREVLSPLRKLSSPSRPFRKPKITYETCHKTCATSLSHFPKTTQVILLSSMSDIMQLISIPNTLSS